MQPSPSSSSPALNRGAATRAGALLVWACRIAVGATFVLSGAAKSIDVWGFIFKIEQYLAVWQVDMPRGVVFTAATTLAALEFLLGFLLLTGSYKRTCAWGLALLMAAMLPLSLYIAVADPVADCGCFGDMLRLSNTATLVKNIVLTALIACLLRRNADVPGLFMPINQWLVALLATVYIIFVAILGYNVQPLIDFRPYPVGTPLGRYAGGGGGGGDDDDDDDTLAGYTFIYEKEGVRRDFRGDSLPDESWTFVDRVELPGAAEAAAGDPLADGMIAVFDPADDSEATARAIAADGEQILLLIPEFGAIDVSSTYLINEVYRHITSRGGTMAAVIATDSPGVEMWRDLSMASYPIFTADDTAIKEIVRGTVALVYLRDGVIQWKRTLSSIDTEIFERADGDALAALDYSGPAIFWALTLALAGLVLLLWGLDRSGRAVKLHIMRVNQKKLSKFAHANKASQALGQSTDNPTNNNNPPTMRKNVVAGNWKMNTTLAEGVALAQAVNDALKGATPKCDVVICTPFTHLASVKAVIDTDKLGLGAENCADHVKGAYTGEVSASMVASTGATYVILGHSERRQYYGETSEILKEKVALALANGLTPIFCIGEVLAERENGTYNEVVKAQIEEALFHLSADDFGKLILAYEPVWAIGTGKTATPEQAEDMHAHIRGLIAARYGQQVADDTSILYGGSCKPSNAKELFAKPDIDGGLIGGAALDAASFMGIVTAF